MNRPPAETSVHPASVRPATAVPGSILIALHVAFFAFQLFRQDPLLSDSVEYLHAARNLVSHGVLYAGDLTAPVDPALYTKRPPLYPLFLVLTGAHTGFVAITLLIQNVLSLFNLLLVVRLFRRLDGPSNAAWLILIFAIMFPSQLIYANMIMSELLLQTLLTLAFYCFARFVTEDDGRYLVVYNVLLAAAALTKPAMYLFVLPNAFLMLALGLRHRDVRPVAYSLIPLILVGGYCTWNAVRTGLFHFSSIQSASLLDYNTYYLLVQTDGPAAAERLVGQVHHSAEAATSFADRQRMLHAGAWDLLRPRMLSYVYFHLRGAAAFFVDPGRFDIYQFFGVATEGGGFLHHFSRAGLAGVAEYLRMQPVATVSVLLIVAAGNAARLIGILAGTLARIPLEIKWGLYLLVLYVAAVTGPVGAARFAVPIFPIMMLAALLGLRVVTHRRRRSPRTHVD